MSQNIVIQVGQCGNQIASRFWELALQEHATHSTCGKYNDSISTFFRNSDIRRGIECIRVGHGKHDIVGLKARVNISHYKALKHAKAVVIDMEEGVINRIKKSSYSELFDDRQYITGVSGSGNNWSVGHHVYGPEYREHIFETVRKEAEFCDSLSSFFMIGSSGGGTGSGLGSYVSTQLQDEYPNKFRFATTLLPSPNDDVVTAPYNSILSLSKLIESADCILPIDNHSLYRIYEKITRQNHDSYAKASVVGNQPTKTLEAFDAMNNIVSNLILNLTSSARFEGTLNVDINDIVTNLVPFSRLKFLSSSMTPLFSTSDLNIPSKRVDQMFTDAFHPDYQLVHTTSPKAYKYLSNALIIRGKVEMSELRRNIDRLNKSLVFPTWNSKSWKTGLCDIAPIGQSYSLLALSNNCCISQVLNRVQQKFTKLYKRKANLHHYLDNMEKSEFDFARRNVNSIIAEYDSI